MAINNWKGIPFRFDEEKLIEIAKNGTKKDLNCSFWTMDVCQVGQRHRRAWGLGDQPPKTVRRAEDLGR